LILKSLQISNYGIFQGIHSINFAQPSIKRITLIGGLNGSGKTTIFDAIQISLFGMKSNLHKENSSQKATPYLKFLESKINRNITPAKGSAISLVINLADDVDIEEDITITRSWKKTSTGVKEEFEVMRNDLIDIDLTNNWIEFISQIISPSLSKLFLFDGEKILHFAKPENTSKLLIQGIQTLLGADLVTSLEADLRLLKKNILKDTKHEDKAQLDDLDAAISNLKKQLLTLNSKLENNQELLLEYQESDDQIQDTFDLSGFKTSKKIAQLEEKIFAISAQMGALKKEQESIIAGSMPLGLVQKKIKSIESESIKRLAILEHKAKIIAWQERDREFLKLLKKEKNTTLLEKLQKSLAASLEAESLDEEVANANSYISNSGDIQMLYQEIKNAARNFKDNSKELDSLQQELEQTQKSLLRAPDSKNMQKIFKQRDASKSSIIKLEVEIEGNKNLIVKLEKDLVMAENRFKRHFEETVKLLQSSSIQKKQLEKIQVVEGTLAKFSKELVWRSLNQFETLITSKFKYLIRKDSLVDSFTIDKQTFMISALNEANQPIQLQDLSAGERQILAISILWSLSEVANIKIPVIIDTPLGRLDSKHRHQLITKYFPEASLQTIILSTDEEIIGPYYKLCKPYVGEEYLCTENPKIKTSGTIIKGYF